MLTRNKRKVKECYRCWSVGVIVDRSLLPPGWIECAYLNCNNLTCTECQRYCHHCLELYQNCFLHQHEEKHYEHSTTSNSAISDSSSNEDSIQFSDSSSSSFSDEEDDNNSNSNIFLSSSSSSSSAEECEKTIQPDVILSQLSAQKHRGNMIIKKEPKLLIRPTPTTGNDDSSSSSSSSSSDDHCSTTIEISDTSLSSSSSDMEDEFIIEPLTLKDFEDVTHQISTWTEMDFSTFDAT